jgi:hypothetical protein
MAYHVGQVGPITYHQDNSGTDQDITTPIVYTPEMFGAPAGSQVITPLVSQTVYRSRGAGAVRNLSTSADAISFLVWTQAADNGLFGHHSGSIDVTTAFTWWIWTADATAEQAYKPSEQEALSMVNPRWA